MNEKVKKGPASLTQRMLRQVLLVAGGASLLFGLLFLALYRDQLARERTATAEQINRLLRVALENAMLKRDVPGLRDIVERMGQQPGISDVMILEPGGEVRFASNPEKLGRRMPELLRPEHLAVPSSGFVALPDGEVLRSLNPVPNQAPCTVCHGALESHPLNGLLVVDYRADTIRQEAWRSAALFAMAGSVVLALTLGALWHLLRRRVVEPLRELDGAASEMARGNLAVRLPALSDDETGRLAASFNRMADSLNEQFNLLAAQQHYVQELLDGLPDGVRVIRQADLRIVAVNRAYCAQLGISEAAALGQNCHVSSHGRATPCASTMVVCPAVELKRGGDSLKCRHHHRTVAGRELPVEVHAVLLERVGAQGSEKLIVEAIGDLSAAVSFSQEQRLTELGLLAAGIAHEIHNPLGSLRLAVDGLLRLLRGGPAEESRMSDYLQMMSAEIDRCTGVTQRLLRLSRLPQQQAQAVPINMAVGDTVRLLEFDAASRNIVQHFSPDLAEPVCLADDADLRMLVLNLVQNAHHAMPEGGTLTVRTGQEAGFGWIEIADTGQGIASEHLQRIFDPFFSRRADGVGGTGLGLTICKSIVDRYAGRIDVDSAPGRGTAFRIYFPQAGGES